MKDARRGLPSLAEDTLPAGSLPEFNEHSPVQVLNLISSTQPSHDTWRNTIRLRTRRQRALRPRRSLLAGPPKIFPAPQHRPGQAGILRRHRPHRLPVAAPALDVPRPATDGVLLLLPAWQDRARPQDQQGAQVAIPGLGDPPQALLAAGTVLSRHPPEPGGELPFAGEVMPVAKGGDQGPGRGRADTRQLHQAPGAGRRPWPWRRRRGAGRTRPRGHPIVPGW